MKRTRLTDEQIIGVLKEAEAGAKTGDLARRHGCIRGDDLQLVVEVRRAGSVRGPATEGS